MANEKQAATEGILQRIWKEEWQDLDLLLSRTGDAQFWFEVLRFELDIGTLTRDLLRADTTLVSLGDFNVQSMSPFHYAGLRGAANVLRQGLQVGLNVDVGLRNGTTVLHLASFAGRLETVALLVDEFQAYVNREDGHRCCPLHYASAQGHQQVVEFLVSRGADIGARDTEGTTAAYHARKHRHQPIASYLLDISGDGDDLLVEEPDARRTTSKTSQLYTSVPRKSKKRLPAMDYEEVEQSYEREVTVETVKDNQDAGRQFRSADTKDAKKHEKRMVYENTEFPLASRLETEGSHVNESKTRHNNGAHDTSDERKEASREDLGLISHSATNSKASNQAAFLDEESMEFAKYKLQLGRKPHFYEEIKLPDDSMTDPTTGLHGYASVEECTNTTKVWLGRRNHVYEEIVLPGDSMPNSEIELHKHNVVPCSENGIKSTRDMNTKLNNDSSYSTNLESNMLMENPTEQEIIPKIDISNFRPKPHKYEEIKLSCDEDPNETSPLNKHQVEQEVRQLLRKEMRKLEQISHKDFNGLAAISGFPDVSENAEIPIHDSHYDESTVITLRHLARLLREEFNRFTNPLQLPEPPSKLDVQKEDPDIVLTSNLTPPATGLYEEIPANCNIGEAESELGQIDTSETTPKKENYPREDIILRRGKKEDDSPPTLPKLTDRRKPEIAEKPNKDSKLHFSPGILRRDPRNRKEKEKETRSPHRSPLRLNTQNDAARDANSALCPRTEQDPRKSEKLSANTGQSQFYVDLDNSISYSES